MKRVTVRGIYVNDKEEILLILRNKFVDGDLKEYYAIPGGGVEDSESLEDAVVRKLKEETGIVVNVLEYLGKVEDEYTLQHFYHVEKIDGRLISSKVLNRNNEHYEPIYKKLDSIEDGMLSHLDMVKKVLNKK